MRTDNKNVARLWANNKIAKSYNGQFSTDGRYLFSYNLVIGWTTLSGIKIAKLYNSPNNAFESRTTSIHVGYAIIESDETEIPLGDRLTKSVLLNKKY